MAFDVGTLQAKLTLDTAQFDRARQSMNTSIGGLGSSLKNIGLIAAGVGAAITTAFAVKAAKSIGEFTVESTFAAARAEELGFALDAIGKANGIAQEEIDKTVQALRDGNIEKTKAISTTARFIQAELDLAESTKLARVAQDLAVISGQDSSEALDSLTNSIVTNNVQTLKQFGILTDTNTILEAYGETIDKAADELTSAERNQAFLNRVLEEGEKVAGTYDAAMGSVSKQFRSLTGRIIPEFKIKIGEAFTPALASAVDFVKDSIEKLSEFIDENKDVINDLISKAIEPVIEAFEFLSEKLAYVVDNWEEIKNKILEVKKTFLDNAKAWNDKTQIFTIFKDELEKAWKLIQDELIPTIIENKEVFIDLAKFIGAVLIVVMYTWIKALQFWIKTMTKVIEWAGKIRESFYALEDLPNFFSDIWGDIESRMNLFVQEMFILGQNIIEGLKNGISNAAQAALDKVSELANGIKNKFKEALSISSPSKVFQEFGRNITEGLAIGMGEETGKVQARIDEITNILDTWAREDLLGVADNAEDRKVEIFDLKAERDALKDQLSLMEDDFDGFNDKLETIKDTAADVFTKFKKRIDDATTAFNDYKKSVKADIEDIKDAYREASDDRADDLDDSIVSEVVSMRDRQRDLLKLIEEEQAKGSEASQEKIEEYKAERNEITQILKDNADEVRRLQEEIAEAERFNNLDAIEQLKQRYAEEQAEAKANKKDQIQTLRDTLKEERELYDDDVKKMRTRRRKVLKGIKRDYKKLMEDLKTIVGINFSFSVADIPKFAGGVTNFGGGMALVGENGPELVNLPTGSDVIPNSALGGITLNVNVSGNTVSADEELADMIVDKTIDTLNSRQEINRQFGGI